MVPSAGFFGGVMAREERQTVAAASTVSVAPKGATMLATVKPGPKVSFHRWGSSSAIRSFG